MTRRNGLPVGPKVRSTTRRARRIRLLLHRVAHSFLAGLEPRVKPAVQLTPLQVQDTRAATAAAAAAAAAGVGVAVAVAAAVAAVAADSLPDVAASVTQHITSDDGTHHVKVRLEADAIQRIPHQAQGTVQHRGTNHVNERFEAEVQHTPLQVQDTPLQAQHTPRDRGMNER